jgi:hypothetical protein
VKSPCDDLPANGRDKKRHEYRRANQVPEVHGHRDDVAARFTQGRGKDLDDPEAEGDLGDLAQGRLTFRIQLGFTLMG